jgi:DedD protein
MVLDPAPRAVPDTIPIDLPSDKTPFAPHLAAPAAAAVPDAGAGAVPAAPGAAADTAADAAATAATAPHPASPEAPAHGKKHAATDAGKIFLQAAAMSRESAARELASRIAKSGLSPFVERTGSGDSVRYRVRLGPFASRSDAERSRARLHALGVDANIVGA